MSKNKASVTRRFTALAGAVYVVGLAVPAPANAAIVTYTFAGSVSNGYDTLNAFGAGADLGRQTFTLIQTFDTEHANYRYLDAQQSFQVGGSHNNAPRSASASLRIGMQTKVIADYADYIFASSSSGHIQEFITSGEGPDHAWAGFNIYAPSVVADYADLPSLAAQGATFIGNYQLYDAKGDLAVYADLRVEQLTVGSGMLAGVPLPPSLPLFGFGLLGLVGYRAKAVRRA